MVDVDKGLYQLASDYFQGLSPLEFGEVGADGSARLMYWFRHGSRICLGVKYDDISLNLRYIAYAKHFGDRGLLVPKILKISSDNSSYLTSYLTGQTLAEQLKGLNEDKILPIYKQIIPLLMGFYKEGKSLFNDEPVRKFDRSLYKRDWDYFITEFVNYLNFNQLLPAGIEQASERLLSRLSLFNNQGFVHRDCQARNIVSHQEKWWFIDFQDGMLGPVSYDLASLLFGGSSALNFSQKKVLWDYYLTQDSYANKRDEFFHMALIRRLRSLGTYAKLGIRQGKANFLGRLPDVIDDLINLRNEADILAEYQPIFDFLAICQTKLND
ncbi:MAG: phosphotransferase [SAR324 cluster bacterium]|nr:phosphotransferase [SAR324 cluster bacterium]